MKNPKRSLTRSQTVALGELEFFYRIQSAGVRTVAGIWTRPCPLIIAPSGSGKTFLVNALADAEAIPVYSINVQNWIVRGAKNNSELTMAQIAEFVRANNAGIIFLDEVNKLTRTHADSSSWTADVFSEIIAFLDCDLRLDSMGFRGIRHRLKTNFFIIGAAAFQDQWRAGGSSNQEVGFGAGPSLPSTGLSAYESAVRKQDIVPDELLFRFSDRLILIEPPTAEEFGARIDEIRKLLDLPPLASKQRNDAITSAQTSGKMYRWLEGYVSDCLREVSDGIAKGAKLDENKALPIASDPIPPEPSKSQCAEPRVEGDGRTALGDYYRMLPELSYAATRAEFAVAEVWRTARRLKEESGEDRAFAAICNATDRLRKLTGREKASLIGCLAWLAKRVFEIHSAESDEARATIANQVTDVVDHLRSSLELLRGQLDVGNIEGRLTESIVSFIAKARLHEGTWNAVVAASRRPN